MRYPLVDGQGNFGNIDGDNAAAMRYTESRLTHVAALLLEGIDEDTVDFRPTYDGSNQEPVVLPANFPNLLANGTSGIAVGMATSIPPHNVEELCNALCISSSIPTRTIEKLVEFVPGPDFPDRRRHRRAARCHPRGLQDGPRRLPAARALGEGGDRARHLPDRRHRDALPGAEGQAGRAHRRADQREEAAAAGRRARRIGRDRAAGAGAQEPHRRSGAADGEPVQADRARGALLAQHECALRRTGARRAVAARRAEDAGWSTARWCWCAAPSSA